ncbi:hypothetical protein HF295_07235 [Hujiaoplasma nucleasis]|uniref:Bacteriophage T5 Orf172 DNA-binding domain-containing protein n=1 Tax=Hujiaoplasma nucleasis TaxID=2725268 RepID=A0A7L6N5X2_9MOLU|nr:GIY-YIG nuclease family protein [Hujiaoplasma nucleasis]QLY40648.1 hypothetical protein HF295_07235 [Hujiaoplasma nucleasis]
MDASKLKGWNYIVYVLVKNNFESNKFSLAEIYEFEPYFKMVYPDNYHIKDKIRQTLQKLRDHDLLKFFGQGEYQLLEEREYEIKEEKCSEEVVYLLTNESIPGWVKIGRSNSVSRRLKELYNTSVPLPFILEDKIVVDNKENSFMLEKSIHSIIDTINPSVRKNTEAKRREFFKLTVDQGKMIFQLVTRITRVNVYSDMSLFN